MRRTANYIEETVMNILEEERSELHKKLDFESEYIRNSVVDYTGDDFYTYCSSGVMMLQARYISGKKEQFNLRKHIQK